MNFKRRLSRANKEPHCCGQKMIRKESYDTKEEQFYFCEKRGKFKITIKYNRKKEFYKLLNAKMKGADDDED